MTEATAVKIDGLIRDQMAAGQNGSAIGQRVAQMARQSKAATVRKPCKPDGHTCRAILAPVSCIQVIAVSQDRITGN